MKVSILLPTYNGAPFLDRAIRSVIAQKYQDWELFIIDDGSTDHTQEVIDRYVGKDVRIQAVRNQSNLGIQKSLNRGLALARGEYIARIDSDDVWTDTGKLNLQLAFFAAHPDHVVLGTGATLIDINDFVITKYFLPEKDATIRDRILAKNCFVHSSVLFKTQQARELGGYSESPLFLHVEDHELWLRLGLVGKMANIPRYTTSVTIAEDTVTAKNRIGQTRKMLMLARLYRKNYPGFFGAYLVLLVRLAGFCFISILPIPKRLLYKIQTLYRSK